MMVKPNPQEPNGLFTKPASTGLLATVPEGNNFVDEDFGPVIARSNPWDDLRPFIEYLWRTRKAICQTLYTDEFPRGTDGEGATRSQEDEFLLRSFNRQDLHRLGGAFLKQALYAIAVYNDNEITNFVAKWSDEHQEFYANPSQSLLTEKFLTANEEADHDNDFLKRVNDAIRYGFCRLAAPMPIVPSQSDAGSDKTPVPSKAPLVIDETTNSIVPSIAESGSNDTIQMKLSDPAVPATACLTINTDVNPAVEVFQSQPLAKASVRRPSTNSSSRPQFEPTIVVGPKLHAGPVDHQNGGQRKPYRGKKHEQDGHQFSGFVPASPYLPVHPGVAMQENLPAGRVAHPGSFVPLHDTYAIQSGPLPNHPTPFNSLRIEDQLSPQFFTGPPRPFPSPAFAPVVGGGMAPEWIHNKRSSVLHPAAPEYYYLRDDPRKALDHPSPRDRANTIHGAPQDFANMDPNSFRRLSNDRSTHSQYSQKTRYSNEYRRTSGQSSEERFFARDGSQGEYNRRNFSDQSRNSSSFETGRGSSNSASAYHQPHRGSFSNRRPSFGQRGSNASGSYQSGRYQSDRQSDRNSDRHSEFNEVFIAPDSEVRNLVLCGVPRHISGEDVFTFLSDHAQVEKVMPAPRHDTHALGTMFVHFVDTDEARRVIARDDLVLKGFPVYLKVPYRNNPHPYGTCRKGKHGRGSFGASQFPSWHESGPRYSENLTDRNIGNGPAPTFDPSSSRTSFDNDVVSQAHDDDARRAMPGVPEADDFGSRIASTDTTPMPSRINTPRPKKTNKKNKKTAASEHSRPSSTATEFRYVAKEDRQLPFPGADTAPKPSPAKTTTSPSKGHYSGTHKAAELPASPQTGVDIMQSGASGSEIPPPIRSQSTPAQACDEKPVDRPVYELPTSDDQAEVDIVGPLSPGQTPTKSAGIITSEDTTPPKAAEDLDDSFQTAVETPEAAGEHSPTDISNESEMGNQAQSTKRKASASAAKRLFSVNVRKEDKTVSAPAFHLSGPEQAGSVEADAEPAAKTVASTLELKKLEAIRSGPSKTESLSPFARPVQPKKKEKAKAQRKIRKTGKSDTSEHAEKHSAFSTESTEDTSTEQHGTLPTPSTENASSTSIVVEDSTPPHSPASLDQGVSNQDVESVQPAPAVPMKPLLNRILEGVLGRSKNDPTSLYGDAPASQVVGQDQQSLPGPTVTSAGEYSASVNPATARSYHDDDSQLGDPDTAADISRALIDAAQETDVGVTESELARDASDNSNFQADTEVETNAEFVTAPENVLEISSKPNKKKKRSGKKKASKGQQGNGQASSTHEDDAPTTLTLQRYTPDGSPSGSMDGMVLRLEEVPPKSGAFNGPRSVEGMKGHHTLRGTPQFAVELVEMSTVVPWGYQNIAENQPGHGQQDDNVQKSKHKMRTLNHEEKRCKLKAKGDLEGLEREDRNWDLYLQKCQADLAG